MEHPAAMSPIYIIANTPMTSFRRFIMAGFPATNPTQLQPQIDKTIQYEKYTMPDPTYFE